MSSSAPKKKNKAGIRIFVYKCKVGNGGVTKFCVKIKFLQKKILETVRMIDETFYKTIGEIIEQKGVSPFYLSPHIYGCKNNN